MIIDLEKPLFTSILQNSVLKNFKSHNNLIESLFKIKTFKSLKEVMVSFFKIKNFKSRKKVCSPFSVLKSLRVIRKWWNPSSKAVMEFYWVLEALSAVRNRPSKWQLFMKLSYDAKISWNNIFSVSSHWISLTIHFFLWLYILISRKKDADHISVNTVRATFLLHQ